MGCSAPDGNGLKSTGKTLVSIAIIGALLAAGRIKRVLIVAPLSILGVWEDEFKRFADFPYQLIVLNGTIQKKIQQLRFLTGEGVHVVVVNYESAWRMEKELANWHPDLIIADEGHKIKTHNTSVSKAMHRLGLLARYRLLLTGTVITNKAIDVFSQYKFLDPRIFGNSFYAFRNRYFNMVGESLYG
jgi:SNF2 family DNA or RNA helicase